MYAYLSPLSMLMKVWGTPWRQQLPNTPVVSNLADLFFDLRLSPARKLLHSFDKNKKKYNKAKTIRDKPYSKMYSFYCLLVYILSHPHYIYLIRKHFIGPCAFDNASVQHTRDGGLGLVSQRYLSHPGLKVQRSRSRSRLLYRDHETWRGKKWK